MQVEQARPTQRARRSPQPRASPQFLSPTTINRNVSIRPFFGNEKNHKLRSLCEQTHSLQLVGPEGCAGLCVAAFVDCQKFPICRNPVKPLAQKYFALSEVQISAITPPVPRPPRGASRSSRKRRARDAMAAAISGVEGITRKGFARRARRKGAADGKIVWSWRRDPGVDPRRASGVATVATMAAHRGEHEISRRPIARGKPA